MEEENEEEEKGEEEEEAKEKEEKEEDEKEKEKEEEEKKHSNHTGSVVSMHSSSCLPGNKDMYTYIHSTNTYTSMPTLSPTDQVTFP